MKLAKIDGRFVRVLCVVVALLASYLSTAMAAQTEALGKIDMVYVTASSYSTFRVSIHVVQGGTSSGACTGNGWYAAERENDQLKKGFLSAALLARVTQAPVRMVGNGVCDDYGIETISTIAY